MTGKVFDGNSAAFLILILPLAAGIILLYKAWLWILGVVSLTILWKAWNNYQWQQWCFQINPIFNELLQVNQGCLTSMDLSLKANLSARSANRFLSRKAQEYGAYCKELPDKGRVYYFITASTLGSIFDDSEPKLSIEDSENVELIADSIDSDIMPKTPKTKQNELSDTAVRVFSQLAELKEERQKLGQLSTEIYANFEPKTIAQTLSESSLTEEESAETSSELSLIQVDLAKRLDTTPSTIGRRKSEPSFPEWSKSKDPEGVAWKYLQKSRLFVPVDTN
ncbi:MAG: hypothetical protein ACTMUB_10155 [cyanobacterium endosymbiont of Rhopalodia musculus]|uniref:hypothetical protein n=1 Tax=cyanobacterium endosymbiont of Epithemia clementina EcSB TaxID=3034674 RepID=UPI00248109CA|nr:hypothetical protein [cyanobacterium endosymbiont of Epithemia clementina EcSB]WGT68390.1 hypothetical protein P3F56_04945 [cyanobacterium endosymbiont of Epithemia clementina EcSB]